MIENEALPNPYGFLLEPSDWPKRLVTSFGFFSQCWGLKSVIIRNLSKTLISLINLVLLSMPQIGPVRVLKDDLERFGKFLII